MLEAKKKELSTHGVALSFKARRLLVFENIEVKDSTFSEKINRLAVQSFHGVPHFGQVCAS